MNMYRRISAELFHSAANIITWINMRIEFLFRSFLHSGEIVTYFMVCREQTNARRTRSLSVCVRGKGIRCILRDTNTFLFLFGVQIAEAGKWERNQWQLYMDFPDVRFNDLAQLICHFYIHNNDREDAQMHSGHGHTYAITFSSTFLSTFIVAGRCRCVLFSSIMAHSFDHYFCLHPLTPRKHFRQWRTEHHWDIELLHITLAVSKEMNSTLSFE